MTNIPTFLVCLAATAGVCAAEIIVNRNSVEARGLGTSAGLVRLVDMRNGQAFYPALQGLQPYEGPQTVTKQTLF